MSLVIKPDEFGVAYPGIEGGFRHLQLELAQGSLPGLCCFHGVFLDVRFGVDFKMVDKNLMPPIGPFG